jgi:hypothetical protein
MKYPEVYLGYNEENGRICLTAPSWDCGWYWGFGYLGNRNCHYHVDGLTTREWYDVEKGCFRSEKMSLFDGFKKHFGDTLTLTDAQLWTLCELFRTFYTLSKTAELYGRGGTHYTDNPCKELLTNTAERDRINQVLLPAVFKEIYKILTPDLFQE